MKHLRRLVITAVLAGVMLVATNLVSTAPTYADGPYYGNCASWVTQYRTQLVQGAPRWVLRTDFYGAPRWVAIPTTYYASVPVEVCVSYVNLVAPIAPVNVYYNTPVYPSIFDGNYYRWGYTYQTRFYGPYVQPAGLNYLATPN